MTNVMGCTRHPALACGSKRLACSVQPGRQQSPVRHYVGSGMNTRQDRLELRGTFGSRKRKGEWDVPGVIAIDTRMGSTELDFTDARFSTAELLIEVAMWGGSIELRFADGVSVDVNQLATTLASVEDHRKNPVTNGHPRVTINGKLTWGSLEIRGPKGR